jgi:hypothetical protein
MEHLILVMVIMAMSAAVGFVLITHFRQCRKNRVIVNRLESAHLSSLSNSGGQQDRSMVA